MDKVEKLMKKLGISKEDAEKLIIYDKMVDQNKPTPYDLTKEQQKYFSKFIYNIFCEHDADDWTWEEGELEYDAYKMNNPKEWERLNKEMEE